MPIYTFLQPYNLLSLLYSIKPSTKYDMSALFRFHSPCNICNNCITLLFHQGTRIFITFQANGLKMFLLASHAAAFTSLVLEKSVSSFVYIFFNCLWNSSFSPRWKCMKFCFREQVNFFFSNFLLNNLSNGGKGGPAEMLTNIWLMVPASSFGFCVLCPCIWKNNEVWHEAAK